MNEAEYLMKNYGDRGGGSRRIIASEISIIPHKIRKPNSIIVLFFIQNNSQFKNIAKTCLPSSMVKFIFDSVCLGLSSSANILRIADVALQVVFLLFFLRYQPLLQLVPAVILTFETSEVSAILFSQPKQLNLVPRSSRLTVH